MLNLDGGGAYIIEVELGRAGHPVGFEFVAVAVEGERERERESKQARARSSASQIDCV